MTKEDIRRTIIEELSNIAPETDAGAIDPKADLREALDIDSMDFLNFISALHKRLQVDVPEKDYSKLFTLASGTDYLCAKLGV